MTRIYALCGCIIMLASMSGCGKEEAKATVTGEVTFNGKPIERGTITFVAAEGNASPVTVEITNGKYEAATTAGSKKVMIAGTRVLRKIKDPGDPDGPLLEQTEDYVPDKFNVNTELKLDVQKGANTKNWDLEHKK